VSRDNASTAPPNPEGVAVTSPESAVSAERFSGCFSSGKVLDGIHTSFNRRLCRPFVRMLSHTSVTPNAVTFGGIAISLVSAIAFAQGTYWVGARGRPLLFTSRRLFDEMDGMLAPGSSSRVTMRGLISRGFADGLMLFAALRGHDNRHVPALWPDRDLPGHCTPHRGRSCFGYYYVAAQAGYHADAAE